MGRHRPGDGDSRKGRPTASRQGALAEAGHGRGESELLRHWKEARARGVAGHTQVHAQAPRAPAGHGAAG